MTLTFYRSSSSHGRHYNDAVTSQAALNAGRQLNVRHEAAVVGAGLQELERARTRLRRVLLGAQHDLTRREERAAILAANGGSPGG